MKGTGELCVQVFVCFRNIQQPKANVSVNMYYCLSWYDQISFDWLSNFCRSGSECNTLWYFCGYRSGYWWSYPTKPTS